MRWQERGKKEMQGMLLPVIVCVCFIASSLLFLVQMIVKSEEENITDLYNAANQTRTALLKQIEGDWQTLEGLSVSLQSLANIRTDELMEILTDVNDKNAFIRMGYTDASGQGEMVDLAGNIEAISIAEEAFFQRAMEGLQCSGRIRQLFCNKSVKQRRRDGRRPLRSPCNECIKGDYRYASFEKFRLF